MTPDIKRCSLVDDLNPGISSYTLILIPCTPITVIMAFMISKPVELFIKIGYIIDILRLANLLFNAHHPYVQEAYGYKVETWGKNLDGIG